MKILSFLALLWCLSPVCNADLLIEFANESQLPYDLSPTNYDNSESNYDNSISNYDNSESNYDNSPSNYDNSPSNYDNSPSGERRLILEEDGTSHRVGYYVRADNGVLNFFSPTGTRMFYNPKDGLAVFNGKSGDFCGALARVNGRLVLVLTGPGRKILLLSQQ